MLRDGSTSSVANDRSGRRGRDCSTRSDVERVPLDSFRLRVRDTEEREGNSEGYGQCQQEIGRA